MQQKFYACGKLMLTGEYLVLNGALSLAVPTVFGQKMTVNAIPGSGIIHWQAINSKGEIWLEYFLTICNKIVQSNSDDSQIGLLKKIIEEALILNPEFLHDDKNYKVITELEFPNDWGLGSSSTLLTNIANWAGVDPLVLFKNTLTGSGYDVAVAVENKAILYSISFGKPNWKPVVFDPVFKEELFFVYLESKQVSSTEVKNYQTLSPPEPKVVKRISAISLELTQTTQLTEFESLLNEHETLTASVLGYRTVKETLFPDFKGCIKSLGAWGGDFVLVCGNKNKSYFLNKDYSTVVSWNEMVKF